MPNILSVSVPSDLHEELDAEAARQKRSRSFVVVEAVREYLVAKQRDAFAAGSLQTLRDGLSMAPAERVALSESLWSELARGWQASKPWVIGFDTHAEHQRWCREGGGITR